MSTEAEERLVTVRLLRYPVRLGQRATEHYEEMFREFALLAGDEAGPDSVPVRLLDLVDALGRRYPRQRAHEAEREAALARGDDAADFAIEVPPSALDASRALSAMLDEADDFCRQGALLTLQAPEDVLAFRTWYLDECIAQIQGDPATPWPGPLD